MKAQDFIDGGYRFMPGVFQYSAGVAALADHRIVRIALDAPVPLSAGFDFIAGWLRRNGLPLAAFCACELRSPAPFTEAGFEAFNREYVETLVRWGIVRDGVNPVARSNVCPLIDPPAAPSLYAFGAVMPAPGARPSAIVAGSGEVPEGQSDYQTHIVAPGDVSAQGMQRKAHHVVAEMQRRLAGLGFSPRDVSAAQLYTVQPVHPLLESVLIPSGLLRHGALWHYARPPIVGLEFEMDVRVVHDERFESGEP